jgi:hypothetical protein
MPKQTAMMDLRADLVNSTKSSLKALSTINNPEIKAACQKVVSIALKSVIKRIDDELLAMERERMKNSFIEGYKKRAEGSNLIFDCGSELYAEHIFQQYFNETYGGDK